MYYARVVSCGTQTHPLVSGSVCSAMAVARMEWRCAFLLPATAANPHGGSSQEGAYRSPLSRRHFDFHVAVTRVVSACVARILGAPRWGRGRCVARPRQRWCMACDNRYAAGTHRCRLRRERRLRSLRSGRSDRSGLHGWGGTACDVQGVTRCGSGASLPMQ